MGLQSHWSGPAWGRPVLQRDPSIPAAPDRSSAPRRCPGMLVCLAGTVLAGHSWVPGRHRGTKEPGDSFHRDVAAVSQP